MSLVSIGEVLWDVFPDARHIGGAACNFAAHAARLGQEVWFVSAVGQDDLGRETLARLRELGLDPRYVRATAEAPTGTVRVFVNDGQPDFTINRPAAYDFPELTEADFAALSAERPRWIYYGTLAQMSGRVRDLTRRLVAANPQARRLYDINLRKDSYTPALVAELMAGATVLKINDDEVRTVLTLFGDPALALPDFCATYARRYGWQGVCVTRGARGCALWLDGRYVAAPAYRVRVADTVGAGDAFAAALVHGLEQGWTRERTADFANRLGALVASRPGAVPPWTLDEVLQMRL